MDGYLFRFVTQSGKGRGCGGLGGGFMRRRRYACTTRASVCCTTYALHCALAHRLARRERVASSEPHGIPALQAEVAAPHWHGRVFRFRTGHDEAIRRPILPRDRVAEEAPGVPAGAAGAAERRGALGRRRWQQPHYSGRHVVKPETEANMKYGAWGLILGAAVATIVGFNWGGWTTRGTSQQMTDTALLTARRRSASRNSARGRPSNRGSRN